MSRASSAGTDALSIGAPDYNPFFYYEDANKIHTVWFLDVVTFLNQLREVRDNKAGGFALYRLGTEDTAIWDAWACRTISKRSRPRARLCKF